MSAEKISARQSPVFVPRPRTDLVDLDHHRILAGVLHLGYLFHHLGVQLVPFVAKNVNALLDISAVHGEHLWQWRRGYHVKNKMGWRYYITQLGFELVK